MLFPTLTFVVFFLVVYPLSWLLRPRMRLWVPFILLASYLFYGYWDWRFVGLLVLNSLVNWALAPRIARAVGRRRRAWLALALAYNLGVLGVFKYYGFFIESVNRGLLGLGLPERLPLIEILLPVGVSFFTFQAISYVVDVYRGELAPVRLADFAVYQAFFPHLVAGPIVRASEFVPQLALGHRLSRAEATGAGLLIARGAFKKVVVSSYLAGAIVDPVFGAPASYSAPEILVAVYAYAIQIYADFSGYTDMAIGLALLLGFRFPQNFDRPYVAANLQEFWRRWHMTLSRWLRDYLYIPLGGSRKGEARTLVNLVITMTLGGLWHGAAGHFVLWGLYQGLGLAIHRLWSRRPGARRPAPGTAAAAALVGPPTLAMPRPGARLGAAAGRLGAWFLTFNFVCVGWVLFRAPTLADGLQMLWRGLTAWGGPAPLVTGGLLAVVGLMLASQALPPDWGERFERGLARLPLVLQGAAMGAAMAAIVALGPAGVAPFIYFQF